MRTATLTTRINIPVNEQTRAAAEKAAAKESRPLSQWARLVLLRELDREGLIRLVDRS